MTGPTSPQKPDKLKWRRWVGRGFLLWAVFVALWIANAYRTRGVPDDTLQSSSTISVVENGERVEFWPTNSSGKPALIFLCGSGVSAHAYAPLLRPVAEAGHPVFIVKLPYRFAPLDSHRQTAADRARNVVRAHPEILRWIIAGHSLGGALACRVAQADPKAFAALVLLGTTHPKQEDLSSLPMAITKVYASNDGIASPDRVMATKGLLPKDTQWIEIKGGNHSQFGHYGHQLFDGQATINRNIQQASTRAALLEALSEIHARE